jgi:hypothetical protein
MFLFKLFSGKNEQQEVERKKTAIYRSLLRREAKIGGELFGPVQKDGKREFFCLDKTTWIWHEEWTDNAGKRHVKNTRYDIRPTGILKAQNGQGYHMVSIEEAQNVVSAIHAYVARVKQEIYAPYL